MQLSRAYLVALGAVIALAAMWMLVLRPHAPGSTTPGRSAPSSPPSSTAAAPASQSGDGGPSAPGVNGLARAVAKAHGAVTTSEQNAQQLQSQSAAASNPAATTGATTTQAPASTAAPVRITANPKTVGTSTPKPASPKATKPAQPKATSPFAAVEHALVQGKVAVIVVWDPASSSDRSVHHNLAQLSTRKGRVVTLFAQPDRVAAFGAITRTVTVDETPTVLVINRQGIASTLTGFAGRATVDQAINDALRGGADKVQTPTLTAFTPGSAHARFVAQANAVCRRDAAAASVSPGRLQSPSRGLQAAFGAAISQVGRLRAIPAPAFDHRYLMGLFAGLNQGMQLADGAASAARAGHSAQARTLLLAAEIRADSSSQALANYGLSTCFPDQAR